MPEVTTLNSIDHARHLAVSLRAASVSYLHCGDMGDTLTVASPEQLDWLCDAYDRIVAAFPQWLTAAVHPAQAPPDQAHALWDRAGATLTVGVRTAAGAWLPVQRWKLAVSVPYITDPTPVSHLS